MTRQVRSTMCAKAEAVYPQSNCVVACSETSWSPGIRQNNGAILLEMDGRFGHRETGGSWGKNVLTNPPKDARSHSP